MLVLSRQRDEQIIIGDQMVTITVVDIRGDKVRLGIEAPKELSVHRREVYEAIQRELSRSETGAKQDTQSDRALDQAAPGSYISDE